jgi:hypothetical protein
MIGVDTGVTALLAGLLLIFADSPYLSHLSDGRSVSSPAVERWQIEPSADFDEQSLNMPEPALRPAPIAVRLEVASWQGAGLLQADFAKLQFLLFRLRNTKMPWE